MSEALRSLFAVFDIQVNDGALKKLESNIDSVVNKLSDVGKAFGLALGANQIKNFVGHQIDAASAIADMSEKLGVSSDALQEFQYAVGLSGVSSESAGQALGFLNRNMGEALGGSKEAASAFASMGITLKDTHGQVRPLGDIIPEIADAFAKMGFGLKNARPKP